MAIVCRQNSSFMLDIASSKAFSLQLLHIIRFIKCSAVCEQNAPSAQANRRWVRQKELHQIWRTWQRLIPPRSHDIPPHKNRFMIVILCMLLIEQPVCKLMNCLSKGARAIRELRRHVMSTMTELIEVSAHVYRPSNCLWLGVGAAKFIHHSGHIDGCELFQWG